MNFRLIQTLLLIFLVSCSQIVVKVQKNPKNIGSTSKVASENKSNNEENAGLLSLIDNPSDLMKDIDSLRAKAAELIIAELSSKDAQGRTYRERFRDSIRKFRMDLISRVSSPSNWNHSIDSFSGECKSYDLKSLDIDGLQDLSRILIKTGILVALSEQTAKKLNDKNLDKGLKEIQSLIQFIFIELGLEVKVEKGVQVTSDDTKGNIVSGAVSFKIISDMSDSSSQKELDDIEVIKISFERQYNKDLLGSLHTNLTFGHKTSANTIENLFYDISIERELNNNRYKNTATIKFGNKDTNTVTQARQLTFAETEESPSKILVTDITNFGMVNAVTKQVSIDVKAKNICKVSDSGTPIDEGEETVPVATATPAPSVSPSATPSPTHDDDAPTPGDTSSPTPAPSSSSSPNQGPHQGPAQSAKKGGTPVQKKN